jgi:hypothetical protein
MTLILSYFRQGHLLQVADRLVTRDGSKYDPIANKNIIYFARDAIVTVGYTGLAYIDNKPTDWWIAEVLFGQPIEKVSDGRPPALTEGVAPNAALGIHQAIHNVRQRLNLGFQKQPANWLSAGLYIVFAGWSFHGGYRPLLYLLGYTPEDKTFHIRKTAQYWGYKCRPGERWGNMLHCLPHHRALPDGELRRLNETLVQCATPDDGEGVLVDTIREIARSCQDVGTDCMSIMLPANGALWARTRYVPSTPQQFTLRAQGPEVRLPQSFAPWVVSPRMVVAPSIAGGGTMRLGLGVKTLAMEAVDHNRRPLDPGHLHFFGSQHRSPPP